MPSPPPIVIRGELLRCELGTLICTLDLNLLRCELGTLICTLDLILVSYSAQLYQQDQTYMTYGSTKLLYTIPTMHHTIFT